MRIGQLQTIDPAGNSVLDSSYEYDTLGNIETKETEHGSYSYNYDAMSRLTAADNPTLDNETYSHDAVGNRLTAGGVSGSITHNRNNELRHYGDISYDYDANGNLTEVRANDEVVWTYVYDAANRLVHAEDGTSSIVADYYYDPFGRRLWKDVRRSAAQSLQRTYFFYSDEGLIAEYDANGQELRSYGYQPDATWTTDPLWLKQQGAYYWYQTDHFGTPQKLTAVNGTVVWSAQYAAFGAAQVQKETVVNNLRFPGQYFDAETRLHYNFQRYYDPGIGRYFRTDPIKFFGSDVNWYGYVGNNSINHIDFSGLQECSFCGHDLTDWLVREMNRNANNPVVQAMHQYRHSLNPGIQSWRFGTWALLVEPDAPWDHKPPIEDMLAEKKGGCPTDDCIRTITLCGMCFNHDVPSNIHYGYVGRMAGFGKTILTVAPAVPQSGGGNLWERYQMELRDDTPAVRVGFELYDKIQFQWAEYEEAWKDWPKQLPRTVFVPPLRPSSAVTREHLCAAVNRRKDSLNATNVHDGCQPCEVCGVPKTEKINWKALYKLPGN